MTRFVILAIDMGNFTEFAKVSLSEAVKYMLLLLFAILAVRLWRRTPGLSGKNRHINSLLAAAATMMAGGIGYFSYCHSMGRLYSYYGAEAFVAGRPAAALALYSKSWEFWRSADALANQGVCLLWTGHPDEGFRLLDQARAARRGSNSKFQDYYEGLYLLYHGQSEKAVSFLQTASGSPVYHWEVLKLFATLQLDSNRPEEAEKLIEPYKGAQVTQMDQAYVMASLDLVQGRKPEARALWQRFMATNLPPFWQSRFDKLGAKIQNQNP